MAGAITTLLNAGFDSFSNLYDVIITFPSVVTTDDTYVDKLAVRAQDFSFTPLKVSTYPVSYKTGRITRPGATFEGDRTFSLTFRNDSAYDLLQKFHMWKHLYSDPSGETHINFGAMSANGTQVATEDGGFENSNVIGDTANYGKIVVKGLKSVPGSTETGTSDAVSEVAGASETDRTGAFWAFESVMAINITEPTYTREGGAPVTFTVEFIYGRMAEPDGKSDGVVRANTLISADESTNNNIES